MDSNIVMTPSEAIKQFFKTHSGSLIFEYEDDEGYEQVVRAALPAKLGMGSVDTDELYQGLRTLIEQRYLIEYFDTVTYRAGIADEILQPRVMYRLRK